MLKYIAKRLLQSVLTLFIIITIIFCLLRLMPEEGYLGANYDKMSDIQRETILTEMGLRDPLPVQLMKFYQGLLQGDFGTSWIYRPNVAITEILADKAPISIRMGLMAMGISLVVGIPLGVLMTRFKGNFPDKLGMGFVVLVMAIPQAVYHLFIQTYLTDFFSLPMLFKEPNMMSWILPTVSLSLYNTATFALWMRRYMVDELNKDYVRLARAKGVKNAVIMGAHVFPNAFVPLIQTIPTLILQTAMGSIYVESLYSVPGMGGLLVDVIQRQDNAMVQALVLIYAALGILGLLLGDLMMGLCDPRITFAEKGGAR